MTKLEGSGGPVIPETPKEPVVPLADWDDNNSSHPRLVWWSRFDRRFQVEVHRTGELPVIGDLPVIDVFNSHGVLCIFDHQNKDKLLKSEEVGLSYGAVFGADVADVEEWREKVSEFVDKELPQQTTK
jgi:hypothetical protein